MKYQHDIAGQRFGRLIALCKVTQPEGSPCRVEKWECRCDCGNISTPSFYKLVNGKAKSCGCMKTESIIARSTRHNAAKRRLKSRLYTIWMNMRQRCGNPKSPRFKDYGGKGVSVCQLWRDNFLSFQEWALSNGYSDKLTIDRKNPNGDYTPENCRWITLEENSSAAHSLPHGVKEKAICMMLNGATRREAADAVGVHITTTIRWAHEMGLM